MSGMEKGDRRLRVACRHVANRPKADIHRSRRRSDASVGMLACCAQDALAQVGIRRARSCGRWIEARVKVGIASTASEAWLTDYLSGLAAVSNLLAGMAPPCEPC